MLRFLQNYPHLLEVTYDFFERLAAPFSPILKPGSIVEPAVVWVEQTGKGAVFNCQMCGQCILHSTGMTCPMNCPKTLRNGPCGGVRTNGNCEVKPDMRCVWVEAYERSLQMQRHGHDLLQIQPILDRRLQGSASWINNLHGIDQDHPVGWINTAEIPVIPPESKQTARALWTPNSKQADV
jgi:hypothetical protein